MANTARVTLVVPTVSHGQVSRDLVWLTETLTLSGAAERYAGGILGGEYGYGVEFENDVFQMHPFCWCDQFDCPWCAPCECPEDSTRYYVAGVEVDGVAFFAAGGYGKKANRAVEVPELKCANCKRGTSAPNFLHKRSGSTVHWYKYIGRGMQIELHGNWRKILMECVDSIGGAQ